MNEASFFEHPLITYELIDVDVFKKKKQFSEPRSQEVSRRRSSRPSSVPPNYSLSTNKPCLVGEHTTADRGSPTYYSTIVLVMATSLRHR